MAALSFLTPANRAIASRVLADLGRGLGGTWLVAGSLSYRPALPARARASHLRDIDIALDPYAAGMSARSMVKPDLTDRFSVVREAPMYSGSYFGLTHRDTRLWVDVYVAPHRLLGTPLDLGGHTVTVQLPEETFFALVKDLLFRHRARMLLKEKWTASAGLLWRHVHRPTVFDLMARHGDELRPLLPDHLADASPAAVVEHTLALPACTPGRRP
jgi:hypothetical protein